MPLSYSNTSPAGSALKSKINPNPLGLSQLGNNQTTTPATGNLATNLYGTSFNAKPSTAGPPVPYTPPPTSDPARIKQPGQSEAPPSTGVTSDHISGLIKTVGGLQKMISDYGKFNPPPQTNPTQAGLINDAASAYKRAGAYQSETLQQQSDAENNPDYVGGTGVGISGQIERNRAARGAGLLTQAQGLGSLAGQIAPVSTFGGILKNPITGENISKTPGSGAFEGGQVQGQIQAGQNNVQMTSANTAARGIQGTIQQYLAQNPDINSSQLAAGNFVQQWLQGKQLADPKYQTLFNYLNEYTNTLAPILGVGGDPTNLKTEIAQSFINAQASGQSISQVLDSIAKLAEDKVANLQSGALGGPQVAGAAPSSQTGQVSSGGLNFVQDTNGKWVPAK